MAEEKEICLPGNLGFLYLDPLRLDAVRESANLGACHAAQALTLLLGRRVDVRPPEVKLLATEMLLKSIAISAEKAAVAVDTVLGDIVGQIAFIMPQDDASPSDVGFTMVERMEPQAFRQAADLVIGAYLENLSLMMGLVVSLVSGSIKILSRRELMDGLASCLNLSSRFAFCIDSRFVIKENHQALTGHFLFLPEEESLPTILHSLLGGSA